MDNLSRKRSRIGNEDEGSEFMPLSKRINNLHLNNTFSLPKPLGDINHSKMEGHKDLVNTNERVSSLHYDIARGIDDTPLASPPDVQWAYSPELAPSENPFYYEPNRLLFELYQQRIQRQPPGPHF